MKKLLLQNYNYQNLITDFKEWLDILGLSSSTVYNLPNHLQEFLFYLEAHGLDRLAMISTETIQNYYRYLQQRPHQTQSGALSKAYLNKHLQALKKFNEYLNHHDYPCFSVPFKNETSHREGNLNILAQHEIHLLFNATQYSHKLPRFRLRDKALLVLLYSCGLRRNEAMQLNVDDILFTKNRIHVRLAKNYRERFVPINSKNSSFLEAYLYEARSQFYGAAQSEALLLSQKGGRLTGQSIAHRLQAIIAAAATPNLLEKHITPHSLRHSIATHLLEKNVSLEHIKTFLGHRSLESTQIYTHLLTHTNYASL